MNQMKRLYLRRNVRGNLLMNLKKNLFVCHLEIHSQMNLENWKGFLNWMNFLKRNYSQNLFENLTQNHLEMETN
jgi:hypothetical protein